MLLKLGFSLVSRPCSSFLVWQESSVGKCRFGVFQGELQREADSLQTDWLSFAVGVAKSTNVPFRPGVPPEVSLVLAVTPGA